MPRAVGRPTWIAASVAASAGAAVSGWSCVEAWRRYVRETSLERPAFPDAEGVRAHLTTVSALFLLTLVMIGAAGAALLLAYVSRAEAPADAPWK